jgi:hypothetical protein
MYFQLVPRLRMVEGVSLLPLYAFMPLTGRPLPLPNSHFDTQYSVYAVLYYSVSLPGQIIWHLNKYSSTCSGSCSYRTRPRGPLELDVNKRWNVAGIVHLVHLRRELSNPVTRIQPQIQA